MRGMKAAGLLAMVAGLSAGLTNGVAAPFRVPAPKRVRRYPMPVISSPEEIAAWNEKVDQRNAARRERRARAWMDSASA